MGNNQDKSGQESSESRSSVPNTPSPRRSPRRKSSDKLDRTQILIEKRSSDDSSGNYNGNNSDSDITESIQTIKLNSPKRYKRTLSNQLEPFNAMSDLQDARRYSIQIDTDQLESLESILNNHSPSKRNIRVEVDEIGPSSEHRRNIRIEADQLEAIRSVMQSLMPQNQSSLVGADNPELLSNLLKMLASKRQSLPREPGISNRNERALSRHYIYSDTDIDSERPHQNQTDSQKYEMRVKSDQIETTESKSGKPASNRRNIRIEFDKVDPMAVQLERITPDRFYSPLEQDLRGSGRPDGLSEPSNSYNTQRSPYRADSAIPMLYHERPGRYISQTGSDQIPIAGSVLYREVQSREGIPRETGRFESRDYVLNRQRQTLLNDRDHIGTRGPILVEEANRSQMQSGSDEPGYLVSNTRQNLQREMDDIIDPPRYGLYRKIGNEQAILREEPAIYRPDEQWRHAQRESDQIEPVRPSLYRPESQRGSNLTNIQEHEPIVYALNNQSINRYGQRVEPNQLEAARYLSKREEPKRQNVLREDDRYERADSLYYKTVPNRHSSQSYSHHRQQDMPIPYRHTLVQDRDQRGQSEGAPYRTSPVRVKRIEPEEFESSRPVLYRSSADSYGIPRESDEAQLTPSRYRTRYGPEEMEVRGSSLTRESDELKTIQSLLATAGSNRHNAIYESGQFQPGRTVVHTRRPLNYMIREEESESEEPSPTVSRHRQ